MGRCLETLRRVVLIPLFSLACSPALELPDGVDIVCASDADCPNGRVCLVVVGRCIDPTIVDDEAPVMLAASALDATLVVLDFSERIDPGSVSSAGFTINPALAVTAAAVEPNLRQVRLATALQEPGVEYTITTRGVVDLADNVIADNSAATFNGFGAAPDREPPALLAPRGALPLESQLVSIVWTRRALARSYTVEVAYDPAFTQVVDGFPVTVDDPENSVIHTFTQPVRHYVRVRANTTRVGEYGEGSFDRIENAVYVHCAAGTVCTDVDAANRPLPGNVSAPLRTVVGAIRLARALGISTIRIAGRGGGEPYREHVLSGTLNLYGGYDATFTARDPALYPTVIEDDDNAALFIFGNTSLETVIEGLTLRSARGTAVAIASGVNLTLRGNVVEGATWGMDATGVDNLYLADNIIRSYPGSNGSGVRIASSIAIVVDNTVIVDACGAGPCNNPVGVTLEGLASVLFSDNTITVASSGAAAEHRGLRIDNAFVEVHRNRITTGAGRSAAVEVSIDADIGQSSIRNNVLMTGPTLSAGTETYGILTYDPAPVTPQVVLLAVANNLVYAGGGPGTAKAVSDGLVGSIYVNNIMLTGPGATRYCLCETWADRKIANFQNNVLLECPTALYRDVNDGGTIDRNAIADVNDQATTTQNGVAGSVGGNVTAASLAAVSFVDFPNDVRLTSATPASIRLGGLNAGLTACGPSGFFGCGGVRDDLARVARTCPTPGVSCFSMGPYELDP